MQIVFDSVFDFCLTYLYILDNKRLNLQIKLKTYWWEADSCDGLWRSIAQIQMHSRPCFVIAIITS